LVVAARGGDQHALDALVAQSLPLVYNIVGRALNGHADVDDVVQETLIRVVRHLPDLRDPHAFRSWLVAIAVRQVRDREQYRRTVLNRSAELDAAQAVPDPAADFAELTVLRLGLTDQRREVAEATRWLEEDDRTLLALWWLEETGELNRAELALALGLSAPHAAVRVQRMKEQVQAARTVVRALRARPGCTELAALTRGWDGRPSALWRKRLARHVRDCAACASRTGGMLPMDRLLAGVALVPLPAVPLAAHAAVAPGWAAAHAAAGHGAAGHGVTGHGAVGHGAAAHAAAGHGAAGHGVTGHGAAGHGVAGHGVGTAKGGVLGARGVGLSRTAPARRLRSLLTFGSHGPLGAVGAAATCAAVLATGAFAAVHLTGSGAPPAAAAAAPSAVVAPSVVATSALPSSPASPTPPSSPSPSSRPKPSHTPAAPPAPAVVSAKKGVCVWNFSGVSQALAQSKASWYYTWSTTHSGVTTPSGVQFVPMIWGSASVTASALSQAKSAGHYLLGFNEPDRADQANMTVAQALDLWPQLMATGLALGSPAVATGGDRAGGWLDQFMSGAASRGYRVDFVTLHWYGGDFTTSSAVSELKSYLSAVYQRYHKPIWLTEYALIDFANGTSYPSQSQQAAFVTASAKMLGGLSYVQRYAWFGLPAADSGPSTGLFHSGPSVTAVGRAFEAAG
jgi:RNA polymerase sigma factor (sigma-70 family)